MNVIIGGSWSDLLTPENFVRMIIEALLLSWKSLSPPDALSGENDINRKLCAALKTFSARANLPFFVDSQWELLDDDGNVIGVPDIRFTPNTTRTGEHFYVIECKLLRYPYNGKCKSGNWAYIDGDGQGMTAFLSQRYPTPQGYGGMVGYLLCSCDDPIGTIRHAMAKKHAFLGLMPGSTLSPSKLQISGVFETEHQLAPNTTCTLHHVFLDASDCTGNCQ